MGRKPVHSFNLLEVGQKAALEGAAAKYPGQFIYQFNKTQSGKKKLKLIKTEQGYEVERVE